MRVHGARNMLGVIKVNLRGVLLRTRPLTAAVSLAFDTCPVGPVVPAGRPVSRHLCSRSRRIRSCTVDQNLEEKFVFVDLTDPEEEQLQKETSLSSSAVPSAPPPQVLPLVSPSVPPKRHLKSLEQQLKIFRDVDEQQENPDSQIQFYDVDFPMDEEIISSKKKKKKKKGAERGEHRVVGTPDVDEPISNTCCSGCGAILHCAVPATPGYLPSEKFKALLVEERLGRATCQRCFLLTHHHQALSVQVTNEEYRQVVQRLQPLKALVLLIVDLLDVPDSIIPNLVDLVGSNKHIVVLGNKVDLLPGDAPNYLHRIKRQLSQYCKDAGFGTQVTDIHLISAKTGYGVEGLISSLQRSWRYNSDVYLVGTANAGKSTLFNTLLESDYCKSKSPDTVNKATISPWPGTTLNLLKFPIINPTPYRMFKRQERLNVASQQIESELSQEELKRLRHFSRQGYLVGRVGRTFLRDVQARRSEIEFDPDSLAFGENEDGETKTVSSRVEVEFTPNELKDARWLFDTPGIMKERDILSVLSEHEVASVVPTKALVPRTFVLKPSTSLLVGALGRIDFLQGERSCWLSVLVSSRVPIHITSLEKVDSIYEKHAGGILLGVPQGGSERMKTFPALVPQDVTLEGRGYTQASADITLSSAGWVAVTAAAGEQLSLRVHGPEAAGFGVRTPPLLPHVVTLKGERIKTSSAYKPVKTAGVLDSGLSAREAERLKVKKKKKKRE